VFLECIQGFEHDIPAKLCSRLNQILGQIRFAGFIDLDAFQVGGEVCLNLESSLSERSGNHALTLISSLNSLWKMKGSLLVTVEGWTA